MESEFENKIIELVDIEALSYKELVFLTEIILKDKPNPITKRLLQIIKQECTLNDL